MERLVDSSKVPTPWELNPLRSGFYRLCCFAKFVCVDYGGGHLCYLNSEPIPEEDFRTGYDELGNEYLLGENSIPFCRMVKAPGPPADLMAPRAVDFSEVPA
jgi:hypothetical protein